MDRRDEIKTQNIKSVFYSFKPDSSPQGSDRDKTDDRLEHKDKLILLAITTTDLS
jgi:hypothetical protein